MSSGIHIINRMAYVGNSNPIQHLKALHAVIASEGSYLKMKQREFYEKPTIRRRRIAYELRTKTYGIHMLRKIEFLRKGHAPLPML